MTRTPPTTERSRVSLSWQVLLPGLFCLGCGIVETTRFYVRQTATSDKLDVMTVQLDQVQRNQERLTAQSESIQAQLRTVEIQLQQRIAQVPRSNQEIP